MQSQSSLPVTQYVVISLNEGLFTTFVDRNSATGIAFRHFAGVDGKTITSRSQTRGILAEGATRYSPGAVGCAMSHAALWKQCASSADNFVIFEDDALLRDDFVNQYHALLASQRSWDVIFFGCNTDTIVSVPYAGGIDFTGQFSALYPNPGQLAAFAKLTDAATLLRLKFSFGPCGYVISPAGARKLIEKCLPMDNRPVHIEPENRSFPAYSIDCMMIAAYSQIDAFMCFPPLVMTPNDQATSQTVNT